MMCKEINLEVSKHQMYAKNAIHQAIMSKPYITLLVDSGKMATVGTAEGVHNLKMGN
jgi:hypothetical protein